MTAPLLSIEGLTVALAEGVPLVRDLTLAVARGEVLAVVGESGCGKSMTALAVMGLLPAGIAVAGGAIRFDGTDLARLSGPRLRDLRGRRIAMIFQEPMTSLNPVLTIGEQVAEVVMRHERAMRRAARARALEMLEKVRLPDAAKRLDAYPHQLSGGQRQRVMIAAALACGPDLIIADEPTTALDVTIQAEILHLLDDLRRDQGLALMLITHDLGVVATMADRVAVMYAGRKVEEGPVGAVLVHPMHPYTRLLMAARPDPARGRTARLVEIAGNVPSPRAMPPGCAFAPRCPEARAACRAAVPPWAVAGGVSAGGGHGAACILHRSGGGGT
ncbi:MAG: ABC transporter ATP-binding protein [Gemmobacter sp.]